MSEDVSCPVCCQWLGPIIAQKTYPLPPGVEVGLTVVVVVVMARFMLALETKVLPFLLEKVVVVIIAVVGGAMPVDIYHSQSVLNHSQITDIYQNITRETSSFPKAFPLSTRLLATVFVESYTPASPTTQQNPFT